jgi:hypothetical protein
MFHRKIHPSKIALVPFDRILDGTVTTLDDLKTDTEAWLVPQRIEDGVTLNFSGDQEDYEEQGSSGILVLKDSVNMRRGLEFTINLGRWNFIIEQTLRGGKSGDVEETQTLSIDAADDATAVKGLGIPATLTTQKFAVLFEMPANKSDSNVLYQLVPKAGISVDDREQALTHAQQTPALTFKAYGLETADPDELTPVQDIYSEATDDGLIFPVEGQPDAA